MLLIVNTFFTILFNYVNYIIFFREFDSCAPKKVAKSRAFDSWALKKMAKSLAGALFFCQIVDLYIA